MKPLIVGEAPSKNEVTERPIEGRIGRRLASLAGLSLDEFLSRFERVNLLHARQDTAEKGFTFDHTAASAEAERLSRSFAPGQTVLLLGWRVARAFGVKADHFAPLTLRGAVLYVVPHPSGVSRWWNDVDNWHRAEEFMHRIASEAR